MTQNELNRWLKKEIKFLTEHSSEDWEGAWHVLNDNYAVTLMWEDGFGDIEREDVIQHSKSNDYALVVGIKTYTPKLEHLEQWRYPWTTDEDGNTTILVPPIDVKPQEDTKELSRLILDKSKTFDGVVPNVDGHVNLNKPTEDNEEESEIEKEEPVIEAPNEKEPVLADPEIEDTKSEEIIEEEPKKDMEEPTKEIENTHRASTPPKKQDISFEEFNDGEPLPVDFDEKDFALSTQTPPTL